MDVVALAQDRCYVAVNTKTRFPSLFVHRYKRNETEKGGEELEEGCVFRVSVPCLLCSRVHAAAVCSHAPITHNSHET